MLMRIKKSSPDCDIQLVFKPRLMLMPVGAEVYASGGRKFRAPNRTMRSGGNPVKLVFPPYPSHEVHSIL